MADFTTNQQIVGGSAISAQSPVEAPRGALAGYADSLNNLVSNSVDIFQESQRVESIKTQQRLAEEKALAKQQEADALGQATSQLARQQLKISEAVASGEISSLAGRTQMRSNLTRAIANNPNDTKELLATHASVIGSSKLSSEAINGTQEEQDKIAYFKRAADSGFIIPGMTDAQKEQAAAQFAGIEANTKVLSYQQAKVSYAASTENLAASRANRQEAQMSLKDHADKRIAQSALSQTAHIWFDNTQLSLDTIAKSTASQEEKIMAVQQLRARTAQKVQQANQGVGGEYINGLMAPTNALFDAYEKQVSGVNSTAAITASQNKVLVNAMSQNPSIVGLMAATKFNPQMIGLEKNMGAALDVLTNAVQEPPPQETPSSIPPTAESTAIVQGTIASNALDFNAGRHYNQDTVSTELGNSLNNMLKSLADHGDKVATPTELTKTIDFWAKPEIGSLMSKGKVPVNKDDAVRALSAMGTSYDQKVFPLITARWQAALTGGDVTLVTHGRFSTPQVTDQKAVVDSIIPVFLGSSLTFKAKPGETNPRTLQSVKELNKEVAPIVTKLNLAYTHLSGSVDYKSTYKQYFEPLFQAQEPANATDTGQ